MTLNHQVEGSSPSAVTTFLPLGIVSVSNLASNFYVGWGTLMLINAAIARSMGRSALGWFFGSVLIGPFATLLLALLGPLEAGSA